MQKELVSQGNKSKQKSLRTIFTKIISEVIRLAGPPENLVTSGIILLRFTVHFVVFALVSWEHY